MQSTISTIIKGKCCCTRHRAIWN